MQVFGLFNGFNTSPLVLSILKFADGRCVLSAHVFNLYNRSGFSTIVQASHVVYKNQTFVTNQLTLLRGLRLNVSFVALNARL